MTSDKSKKQRKLGVVQFFHRWVGLGTLVIIVLFALSGVTLNHRTLLAGIHISRNLLPEEFRYRNWNNGAIKGQLVLDANMVLLYGDAGVWQTDSDYAVFSDYSRGMRKGADQRKIDKLFRTNSGMVLAATRSGLYSLDNKSGLWKLAALKNRHVVDVTQKDDKVYILTRSAIWSAPDGQPDLAQPVPLANPPDWSGRLPLFRVVWMLHDGTLFGWIGRTIVDGIGFSLIILCATGIILFTGTRLVRLSSNRGKRPSPFLIFLIRSSRVWHRMVGIWASLILLLSALSGMFLRPPLLLALFGKTTAALPGTALYPANPWKDRMRLLHYDAAKNLFILNTADGFYHFDATLSEQPYQPAVAPPVAVMGIKVLEQLKPGFYLVGSFSGLYLWSPEHAIVLDWITKKPMMGMNRSPVGSYKVSGYLRRANDRAEYMFDYDGGALSVGHAEPFTPMPDSIARTPISLWNLALETHSGRIFTFLSLPYRWLWIPVSGMVTILVTISGIAWWLIIAAPFKKRKTGKGAPC